jgi:CO dehydrogenase maturation factor
MNKYIDSKSSKKLMEEIEDEILGIIPYNQCFVQADVENIPPYELGCEVSAFERIKERLIEVINGSDVQS